MLVVLSHDVDWSRQGPAIQHVIERLNRFEYEERLRFFSLRENIYEGSLLVMDYEQRQGVKSTFFFRPVYDDETTVDLYSDIISELRRGGWEVGLHANVGNDVEAIGLEKKLIERIYSEPVLSLRVHLLRIERSIIPRLSSIGIRFDSSVIVDKKRFTRESSGCMSYGGVLEVPITIMDTYMFAYWGIEPSNAYRRLVEMLRTLFTEGVEVATILWHTNSVRMIGGKDYLRLVEEIWRYEWITPIRLSDIGNYAYLCRSLAGSTP